MISNSNSSICIKQYRTTKKTTEKTSIDYPYFYNFKVPKKVILSIAIGSFAPLFILCEHSLKVITTTVPGRVRTEYT